MLRKLAATVALTAAALAGGAALAAPAQAAPTKPKDAVVLFASHGKTKQHAYWALSWNHPGVIVCVSAGDRAEAVYRISRVQKRWPKKGYYWGGRAARALDARCAK